MHLLYSTERPTAGNLHYYHLPKGWVQLELVKQTVLNKETLKVKLKEKILADPSVNYYLQYKPTFSSADKINLSFSNSGFLKSISTEKEYPTWEELINQQGAFKNQKVKSVGETNPQLGFVQEEVLWETLFDPFDAEALKSVNEVLQSHDDSLEISIDDLGQGESMDYSQGASQELKPGIFCRPRVPVHAIVRTPKGKEKQLLSLPHEGRTHFIEVPASRMVHSKLKIDFDELGFPQEINVEKGSFALALFQTPLRILRSIASIITEIFQLRINWKTLATKSVESDIRYQEAVAKADQMELRAEQEALKASLAMAETDRKDKELKATERVATELADENKFIQERSFPGTEELQKFDVQLQVIRYSSGKESTLGMLFNVTEKKKFLAYTIEDEHQEEKVKGDTRIPNGTYEIKLRKEGGFHTRYKKKFKDIHKGMLHIVNVPKFEYILIHVGNTDDDTAGCLLVADGAHQNLTQNGRIESSTRAYERIYPELAKAIEDGKKVGIQYVDYDMHS
ncbi:MAG: DUF5675 family protein [Bacteroidia bacterium]|nr:DUF5675 family protein [Bacteroidia bacterium]